MITPELLEKIKTKEADENATPLRVINALVKDGYSKDDIRMGMIQLGYEVPRSYWPILSILLGLIVTTANLFFQLIPSEGLVLVLSSLPFYLIFLLFPNYWKAMHQSANPMWFVIKSVLFYCLGVLLPFIFLSAVATLNPFPWRGDAP